MNDKNPDSAVKEHNPQLSGNLGEDKFESDSSQSDQSTMQTPTEEWDLSSHRFVSDPYPTYKAFSSKHTIYRRPKSGDYYVSDLNYIKQIFKDTKSFSSDRVSSFATTLSPAQYEFARPLIESLSKWLLFQDAPKHLPLRRIVNDSLNHKLINKLEPHIKSITHQLIDEMIKEGNTDLVQGIAYPLPAMVIAHMVGVPMSEVHLIKKWSDDIAHFMGSSTGPEAAIQAQTSIIAMSNYLKKVLNNLDENEHKDVLVNLKAFQENAPTFNDDDLIANCIMLLFAGHETTTNLITNCWYALHRHPDQLSILKNNPQLASSAVEETMRYDSPVQRIGRMITSDCILGGYPLKKGQKIYMLLGAAHRSEALCENPDQFIIQRAGVKHLGFGSGPHLCSGAALGRLEATIAITTMLERLSDGEPTETPEYNNNIGIRTMKALHIKL